MTVRKHDPSKRHVTLVFDQELFIYFKSRCVQRYTSVNRLINTWMERQVAAWQKAEAKRAQDFHLDEEDNT